MNKICNKCFKEMPLTKIFWDARKSSKDGFRNECKGCRKLRINQWRKLNIKTIRNRELKYERKNRKRINAESRRRYTENGYDIKKKQYVLKNKETIKRKIKEKRKNRTLDEIEKDQNKNREYYLKNKSRIIKQNCEYIKKKLKEDIQWKLKFRLRGRIKDALKNKRKLSKLFDLLGANIEIVRQHLESQFTDEMTWANHGTIWHIDHIKPICSFDLTTLESQKACFHYTNLRPLLAKDNLRKSAQDKLLSIKNII